MSKDGPPADSFVNPQRTGWLTKHGGSGMGANWRKRWFVLDHHYIFYYKQKNDKKPVGVVCLADYKLCRKAEQKECKKNFAFILEKGDLVDDLDYPVKSYLIYADAEQDMTQWINDINVEIQPTTGRRAPTKEQVKIDEKAFDEVSTTASENPKLVHPTAARPRVKGRRPPRRYIPFHEDDSKEESVENSIAPPSRTSPTAQPKQSSPFTEPKSPSIAKKPKHFSSSPSLRKPFQTGGGSPGSIKKKPMTPKNKPILPREDSKVTSALASQQAKEEEGVKPKTPPAPRTTKPKLPPAASKPQKKSVDGVAEEKATSPSLHKKLLVSEEPSLSKNGIECMEKIANGDVTPGADSTITSPSPEHRETLTHRPVPRPKPRKAWDMPARSPSPTEPTEQATPTEQFTPTKVSKPRPVPRARTTVSNKPTKSEATVKDSPEEEQAKDLPAHDNNDVITVAYQQALPSDSMDAEPQASARDKEDKKEPVAVLRQISYQNVTINIKDSGEVTLSAPLPDPALGLKEISQESQIHPAPVDDKPLTADNSKQSVEGKSPPKGGADVDSSVPDDSPPKNSRVESPQEYGSQKKNSKDSNATKPTSRQESVAESAGSASPGRAGQKKKQAADSRNQTPEHKTSSPKSGEEEEHYVEVDAPGVQVRPSSPDVGVYDIPRPSYSPDPQLGSPFVPEDSSYDIPRPLNVDALSQAKQKSSVMNHDASKTSTSPLSPAQSEHEIAPVSSLDSTPTHLYLSSSQAGPDRRENGIDAEGNGEGQHNSVPLVGPYGPSPRRDPWGYAIINKDSANGGFHVAPEEPHDWLANHLQTVESGNVPECVQKAKELLRQARIIKAQAEESRKEACRELELARRERHDAALMKKNAAEILRIAKEKLKVYDK